MTYLLKGAAVYSGGAITQQDILIENGVITKMGEIFPCDGAFIFNFENCFIFPGFIDAHVHLREPGFSYKETIQSGTMAAVAGGFTDVCTMPNLNPVPDCLDNLKQQLDLIEKTAVCSVHPFGAITVGEEGRELSKMEELAPFVCGFSDDGRGVQSPEMMLSAMEKAKSLSKIISAHCENNALLFGGYIHAGKYAKEHGHRGISSESEWDEILRDAVLADFSGCAFHVCHVSSKRSVELIRYFKSKGFNITAETAPHYLCLCEDDLQEDGKFKMNPPLRSAEDKEALIEAVIDGTINMVATDHAPHSAEEKAKGLEKSLMGIVGLETAFSSLYTYLVKTGKLSLLRLLQLMHDEPKSRFEIGEDIEIGKKASLTVFDLKESFEVKPESFLSKGRATPFEGKTLFGKCLLTMHKGNIVYEVKDGKGI